ncbi:MAG: tetraacyldisaccharide 4'-kinase [Acidobacteriota bacterium]|nr:tetraacyldisaccharide 4'-kinase [Acidobacteriota bacterium]
MTFSRPLRIILWPASLLYGLVVSIRTALYSRGWLKQKRLKGAVISVGNISVGGTGKTPLVIWLAEKLLQQGKRVAILTRGYRGTAGTSDEVELMKSRLQNRVVFGVGQNRFAEGRLIESRGPVDVFLLDDGFQHLQLARDLDIVLLDASRPVGGQPLLPAGPMREKTSAIRRADIIVFTRLENEENAKQLIQRFWELPIFGASTLLLGFRRIDRLEGELRTAQCLVDGPFFAFCGIGNPEAFERDLDIWGLPVTGRMFFSDHHRYTADDVNKIEQAAERAGAKALLTTEKDSWNLVDVRFSSLPVYASVIELQITGEVAFFSGINHLLQARGALP